jgi:cobalt-zinc-cadmium efflux system membrane fusion protein
MSTTILLVDDDTVLSQVLRRVLTRQGYNILEAASVGDALRLAREHRPSLGLIDLCLPDGDGVELARKLEKEIGPLPLILMTAYPLRLRDQPELAQGFAHVLTKPLNLDQLRQTVEQALNGNPAPVAVPAPAQPATHGVEAPAVAETAPPPAPTPATHSITRRALLWGVPVVAGVLVAVLLLGLPALGMPSITNWFKRKAAPAEVKAAPRLAARLVEGDPSGIELAPEVAKDWVGQTEVVRRDVAKRPLVLSGSLSFDLNHLYRIQSRFGGEVVELGTPRRLGVPESSEENYRRPLRYGDRVYPGQLLAVVLCKDLGEKKSELVDALVKLYVDEKALKRYEDLASRGNLPEATLLAQRATVAGDRNAVARAERTLITWKVPDAEILAVKDEATRVQDNLSLRDLAKEAREWARVEVRVPDTGSRDQDRHLIIVEKNVVVGNIIDTTFDLYKVADLSQLGVFVNAYEEDLHLLRQLDLPYPWELRVSADPRRPPLEGTGLEQIGRIVDPNQHTAPVMGRVYNPAHDLEVGQFVTATVMLPAPKGVVALPAKALDEDGQSSIIFVQPDPSKPVYSLRRVVVTQRLGDVVYVRDDPGAVKPGDHIVTRSVVELRATLEDLQARKKQK